LHTICYNLKTVQQNKIHTVPKYIMYSFFIIGLLSAIAFRSIIIFQHVEPHWVRPVWYIGTIGYFLFFLYRYNMEVVLYLLSSIKLSLEDMNYAIIFLLSVVAVIADMILAVMK
jgi:hypothetical protein